MAEELDQVLTPDEDPPVKTKKSSSTIAPLAPLTGLSAFVQDMGKTAPAPKNPIPLVDPGFAQTQTTPSGITPISKDLTPYKPYINNPNPQDPNLDLERANNQSFGEQALHTLGQFGTGVVGGFVQALGTNLDVDQSIRTLTQTQQEYGNILTEAGDKLIKYGQDSMPIYETKPGEFNPSDPGWWMNKIAQSGPMVGMATEAIGETAAITAATEGLGTEGALGNLANKISKVDGLIDIGTNTSRMKNSAVMFGIINRHNMSMMTANQTGKEEYDNLIAKGFSVQDAQAGAAKAASATYISNMPLVALDILGFKAMTFNPVTQAASGGLADAIIDNTFGHIANPLAKSAAILAFESAKGGFEASWQYLASAEGKAYADNLMNQKANNQRGQEFNDYVKASQLGDVAASGFIGGAITGGLFKGYEKLTQGSAKNAFDEQYKTFTDNMAQMHLELNDKINEADKEGNEQEANNLRRQLGIQKALTAVHLDQLQGDTSAFSGYKDFFNKTLTAAQSGDNDTLTQLGLTGHEDFLKQNVPQYLADADHIKNIYDQVKERNKPDAIISITYRKFLMDTLNDQLTDVNGRIATAQASMSDLNNLSSYGQDLFTHTSNINSKSRELDSVNQELSDNTISDEKRQALESVKSQLGLEIEYSKDKINPSNDTRNPGQKSTDDDILKSVDVTGQYQKLIDEKASVEHALTNTRKELNVWQDPAFQTKKKQAQIADVINKTSTTEEVDRAAKVLQTQNELTEETRQQLEQKRLELAAKQEAQSLVNKPAPGSSPLSSFIQQSVPKPTGEPVQPQDNPNPFGTTLQPTAEDTAILGLNDKRKSISNDIDNFNPKNSGVVTPEAKEVTEPTKQSNPNATIIEEDSLFDPAPINESNLTDEKKEGIKTKIADYTNSLKGDLGKEPSFKDLVEDFVNHTSKDQTERNFNLLKLGWELNGNKADFDKVYQDVFSDRKALGLNFFDYGSDVTTEPEEFVQQNEIVSQNEVEKQADEGQFDQTEDGQKVFKHISPYKTVSSTLKFAHLSLPYIKTLTPNAEGEIEVEFKNASDELNQSQYVDSKDLMDPNKYSAGTKMSIRIPDNADDILLANWTKDWDKGQPQKFSEWAKDKDKTSDEYIGRLPMIIYNAEGEGKAFVHDMEWYNPSNIGYADDVAQQTKIIADSRKELLELRKQVLQGEGKLDIEISEKKPGTKYIIPPDKPLMTLEEANPQAKVGYANTLNNLQTKDGIIDAENLINKDDLTIGHKYDLRQAGLDKEGKPTYFAAKLLYPKIDSDAKMSVIQALRIYSAQNDSKGVFSIPEEVKNVRKQMIDQTGLDLFDKADLEKYLNLFIPTVRENVGQGKGAEQRVYDAIESRPSVINGSPFLAVQGGAIVFGIKGMKIDGNNTVNYFYPGMLGEKANDPTKGASMINSMLKRIYQDDFLGKIPQNMDGSAVQRDTNVSHIKYDDSTKQTNVVPEDKYNDYLKKRLQTNIKSFDLGDGNYTTFLQPVINYTYDKALSDLTNKSDIEQPKKSMFDVIKEAAKEISGNLHDTDESKLISDITSSLPELRNLGLSPEAMRALEGLKGDQPDFDPDFETPKASNGEESDLYKSISNLGYSQKDSLAIYNQTKTKEFKKWFGNWENTPDKSSKGVDKNGEPLVFYHATYGDFDSFSKDKIGDDFKRTNKFKDLYSKGKLFGFFFTPHKDYIDEYMEEYALGDKVLPVFLNYRDPSTETQVKFDSKLESLREESAKGDALILTPDTSNVEDRERIIIYNPNQIKSIHNNGDFSAKTNNIYYDPNYEALTDDIVRSIKTKLTKIDDLDTIDRGHVVQFIANEVMNKIDPQKRNTVERKQLISEVGNTFDNIIAPKTALINSKIDSLNSLIETGKFPGLQQVVDEFNNYNNNADILKKNWNFLVNEAFEDYISKFTGISIKMNRAQDNIDVEIKDQDAPQELNEHEEDQQDYKFDSNDEREKNYSKESIEDNGKNSVSYLVKRFLAQIPNFDKSGNPKIGFMGVTTYPGFDYYYEAIGKMLTSRGDVPSDYEGMKQQLSQFSEAQPYVNEILKRLDASDQQLKNAFMYNFTRDALSMKFVMTSFDSKSGSYKLKVYDTNANEILRVIQTQWRNNFNQSQLVNSDNQINIVRAQSLLDTYNKWIDNKTLPSANEAKEFLKEFGIEVSDDTMKELVTKGYYVPEGKKPVLYPYSKMFTKSSSSNGVFGLLGRSLELMLKADNKDYIENDSINPYENMSGVLSKLANIESKYSVNLTTNSFRDGDKTIFGFTPGKFATSMVSRLKSDPQVINDKQKISFDRNSFILNLLANDQDFASKFGIDHIGINAFKELGKRLYQDNELNSLSDADHELVKLGMFQDTQQGEVKSETSNGLPLRIARMFFPTMSDKKSMLDISTAVLDLKPKDFPDNRPSDKLNDFMFSQLVEPELQRVISHHNKAYQDNSHPNFLINEKGYNLAAQIFHFLPKMNNLEYTQESGEKVRLIEFLAGSSGQINSEVYQQLVDKIKPDANKLIGDTVDSLVKDKLKLWEDNGYIVRDEKGEISKIKFLNKSYLDSRAGTLEEKLNIAANDYVINSLVNNANMYMLVAGDIANFSQDKAFKNGFERDEQGNPIPYKPKNDYIYSKISKDIIGVNLGKRLAMLVAPGNTIAQSKGDKYIQLFARDRVSPTENLGFLINLYHGQAAEKSSKADIEILKTSKDSGLVADTIKKLSKKFPDLAAYLNIESTDAQEYTTAKEHIDILFRQGRLSEEDYIDFRDKLQTQREAEKKGLPIPQEAFLSTDDLRLIYQPQKPVVTGQMNDVQNDMSRMIYVKSSSFPLIPQVTQAFPEINEVRKGMEDVQDETGKNVRLSYDTANKVGSPLNSNQLELWDNQGKYIPGAIDGKQISSDITNGIPTGALLMDRENFRIQQDVPFKSTKTDLDTVTLGTQMMKEIFGDGISQIEDKIFNHSGVQKSGKELANEVNQHFDGWIRNEKSKLYDQLGIDENTGEPVDKLKTAQKLQNLLQQEAKKRGYPKQDIDALETNPIYDSEGNIKDVGFTIPLWLSPNSNRYEALLNAVVTNRLLNLELPGASFVAGSEEGFRTSENTEDMKPYDSRMIFTDRWKGSLQPAHKDEDGVFHKAQVLAPSKFRDKDGSLLDLFKKDSSGKEIYIHKAQDGTWRLNENMLDDEMKSNSAFRIPTSSRVSMSQDDHVGFLPPEAGDLRIVPKNYTKQKGLDFDVDKENTYMLHHTIDDNGKVIPIEQAGTNLSNYQEDYEGLNDVINSFQKTLDANSKVNKLIDQYKDEIEVSEEMGFNPGDAKKFIKQLKSELDHNTKKSDLKQMVSYMKEFRDLKSKLHQNEIIKAYSSVLGNEDPRVQKSINKVLSTDFAEGQADLLSSLNPEEQESKNFTVLSDQYQKDKMALGAAGKMGIGVYSNYVVFHSLVQQSEMPIHLTKQVMNGDDMLTVPYDVQIGKFKSDGKLGRLLTLDESRSITDVNAERQNTATDNEKLQIMGKTNTNELTINVDATLSLLGFDKDKAEIDGKSQEISIPYFLLSQPIIKDYVDMMRNVKSNIAEYNPNAEFDVITKLNQKYSNNGEYSPTDNEQVKTERLKLDGQKLADNILDGGVDGVSQQAILHLFNEIKDYGDSLTSVQSKLNIQRNGLGKSMFEMLEKYKNVSALASNNKVSNLSSLIGDYIQADELHLYDNDELKAQGYTLFNTSGMEDSLPFAVRPTTTTGSLVVHSAKSGYELWSKYFPHNNALISKTIDDIISLTSGENVREAKKLQMQYEIFDEMKKYLYSSNQLGLFTGDPQDERDRLFFDRDNKEALATYLKNFIRSDHENADLVANNKLISKFTYILEKGKLPSIIKYDNSKSEDFNEEYKYQALVELMDKNKPLSDFQGQPYTSRMLAKDLINYAYLEGGIQEAIQFVKYVPVEYLKEMGFADKSQMWQRAANGELFTDRDGNNVNLWQSILGATQKDLETTEYPRFSQQYIQHNPGRLEKLSEDNVDSRNAEYTGNRKNLESLVKFTPKNLEDDPKAYIAIYNPDIKQKNKNQIYKYDGQSYNRIPSLGVFGMSEYSIRDNNVKPLVDGQRDTVPANITTPIKQDPSIQNTFFDLNKGHLGNTLQSIIDTKVPSSDVAKLLQPYLNSTIKLEIGDVNNGRSRGMYMDNKITIDQKYLDSPTTTQEMIATTILHEYTHALTSDVLNQYFDKQGKLKVSETDLPVDIKRINRLYREVETKLGPELQEFRDWYTSNPGGTIRNNDDRILYAGMNVHEFTAMIMSEPDIQRKMSEIEYKGSGRSLLEQFVDTIKRVLTSIGVKFDENSVTAHGIDSVIELLEGRNKTQDTQPEDYLTKFGTLINPTGDEKIEGLLNKADYEDIKPEDNIPPNMDLSPEEQDKLNPDCIF